ncbi:MAG: SOUL family heme-binding protein [Erythrobacter sp.]
MATGLALAVAGVAATAATAEDETEQPTYAVVRDDGAFELRDYGPMLVAEVTHSGERGRALNAGFQRLAAYIFGRDRPGAASDPAERDAIAMTSPVLQDQRAEIAMTSPVLQDTPSDAAWRTRFVMPARYTLATLPTAPSDISLAELPARRVAAVRFAGYSSSSNLATAEAALREWMAAEGIAAAGPAEFAFYDSPMVPPPMRRNEVLIPVVGD